MNLSTLDRRSFLGGAATALITIGMGLAIALGLGQLMDWSKEAKAAAVVIGAVFGSLLGGFRAGLLCPTAPLGNAGVAAAIGYLPLGIGQRIANGKGLNIVAVIFATLLAGSIGIFGGFVANIANRRRQARS
jgi:hypothetical protein